MIETGEEIGVKRGMVVAQEGIVIEAAIEGEVHYSQEPEILTQKQNLQSIMIKM